MREWQPTRSNTGPVGRTTDADSALKLRERCPMDRIFVGEVEIDNDRVLIYRCGDRVLLLTTSSDRDDVEVSP